MATTLKQLLEIIHKALFIGETISAEIQRSKGVRQAIRIRSAITDRDLEKLVRITLRGFTYLSKNDFKGFVAGGVVVNANVIVALRDQHLALRRYRRADAKSN